ncbi:dethiobiotin synthase [Helicobacter valdiviensis]|uniref:ATP-dependent dethiobiotin synthetase BioD n=1 Tax=Helicobacter valdiviensis TaxID=1458358 RepID=A0A2W6MVH9_9HELI|nr:dethiobiotin synthase [Helicobacter valdiviensis]PZT48427.1 dethiobiotin synthase [Helicobacter valdiviensis]
MQVFIAGSHTDVGKTSVSAALCYGFELDYFKLIQAGTPTDSQKIATLCKNTKIYPQGQFLKTPASPHIGMLKENINYEGLKIPLPNSNNLLVESAGGLFTPLDFKYCMIDYAKEHKLSTILVGGYYLGGINHILLSIHALKSYGIELLALIISGEQNPKMDQFISQYAGVKIAHLNTYQEDFYTKSLELKKELEHLNISLSS